MRAGLIVAYVILAVLIVWVYLQSRTIDKLLEAVLAINANNTPAENPPTTNTPNRTNGANDTINGTDLWDRLLNNSKEVKVDVVLKNNGN